MCKQQQHTGSKCDPELQNPEPKNSAVQIVPNTHYAQLCANRTLIPVELCPSTTK